MAKRAICPLCDQRKGKRACPARERVICAPCCGSKRQVEIVCPPDCVFLTGAHASAWEGRETERRRDLTQLAPLVEGLSDPQGQLFFLALVGITNIRATRDDLDDRMLEQALQAFRKTVQTRERGLLYDHRPEDARAEGLLVEIKQIFESRSEEGQATSPRDSDLLPALEALEKSAARSLREGRGKTAFLDLAGRIAARCGVPPARGGPLIIEP